MNDTLELNFTQSSFQYEPFEKTDTALDNVFQNATLVRPHDMVERGTADVGQEHREVGDLKRPLLDTTLRKTMGQPNAIVRKTNDDISENTSQNTQDEVIL